MAAHHYIEDEAKKLLKDKFNPEYGWWDDAWNYIYEDNDNPQEHYYFEIEEVHMDQDNKLPELPEVEKENLALKTENKELRKKLGHVEGLNAAAKCYLTMYDGGWQYAKEHVLENMHSARFILEDGERGNAKIDEMFESWLEARKKS